MDALVAQFTHCSFPEVADTLRQEAGAITREWVGAVRASIPSMRNLTATEVEDSTPKILASIADALASDDPRSILGLVECAPAQGLSRLALHFDVVEVMQEDRLLREVVVRHIEAGMGRRMDVPESAALHAAVDLMLQRSVIALIDAEKARLRQAAETELRLAFVRDQTVQQRLEQEVLRAATDEQRRIGQDLHDGLCQELVGLSMGAELVARRLSGTAPAEAEDVRALGDAVQAAAEQARRLSHGLNPIDVEAGGLPAALEQLARRVTTSTGTRCGFEWDGRAPEPRQHAADVATNLFRIAQEAVGNAVKHSGAKRIRVWLRAGGDTLTVRVTDNGKGIAGLNAHGAPQAEGPCPAGIGLRTMSYRARAIGGQLTIGPGRRSGLVITCSVRLPRGSG